MFMPVGGAEICTDDQRLAPFLSGWRTGRLRDCEAVVCRVWTAVAGALGRLVCRYVAERHSYALLAGRAAACRL